MNPPTHLLRWTAAAGLAALLASTTLIAQAAGPLGPGDPGPIVTGGQINFESYPPARPGVPGAPTKNGDVIADQLPGATFSARPRLSAAYRAQILTPASTQSAPRALGLYRRYGGATAGYWWDAWETIGGCTTADTGRTSALVITFQAGYPKRSVSLYAGVNAAPPPGLTPHLVVHRTGGDVEVAGAFASGGIRNRLAFATPGGVRDISGVEVYYRTTSCSSVRAPLPVIDSLAWD